MVQEGLEAEMSIVGYLFCTTTIAALELFGMYRVIRAQLRAINAPARSPADYR